MAQTLSRERIEALRQKYPNQVGSKKRAEAAADAEPTRADLMKRAKALDVTGRSAMDKA